MKQPVRLLRSMRAEEARQVIVDWDGRAAVELQLIIPQFLKLDAVAAVSFFALRRVP
jgi:hypothetical protein